MKQSRKSAGKWTLLSGFKNMLEKMKSRKQKSTIPLWQSKLNIPLDQFDKGLLHPNKLNDLGLQNTTRLAILHLLSLPPELWKGSRLRSTEIFPFLPCSLLSLPLCTLYKSLVWGLAFILHWIRLTIRHTHFQHVWTQYTSPKSEHSIHLQSKSWIIFKQLHVITLGINLFDRKHF